MQDAQTPSPEDNAESAQRDTVIACSSFGFEDLWLIKFRARKIPKPFLFLSPFSEIIVTFRPRFNQLDEAM